MGYDCLVTGKFVPKAVSKFINQNQLQFVYLVKGNAREKLDELGRKRFGRSRWERMWRRTN
jgi:hypothetical protein